MAEGLGTDTDTDINNEPVVKPSAREKELEAELAKARGETQAVEMLRVRAEIKHEFPNVDETLLDDVQGSPDQVRAFAEKLNTSISSRIPAPETPVPAPGPGDAAVPNDVNEARREELHNRLHNTRLKLNEEEAQELALDSLQRAFRGEAPVASGSLSADLAVPASRPT